ncbi:MAG TPA: hypothetical protein VKS60_06560 [Stellaceae bacterium]|nr:hypothetical protein [Stellaceae bacterium]
MAGVSFSLAVRKCAATTVKIGVVALRMEASPLAIRVSPYTIKVNGTTLFSRPISANRPHSRGEPGIGSRRSRSHKLRIAAASPTRPRTTVSGGSSATSTLKKKNEPPHSAASASSMAHSLPPIACCRAASPMSLSFREFP